MVVQVPWTWAVGGAVGEYCEGYSSCEYSE